jgi:hypothetical protein
MMPNPLRAGSSAGSSNGLELFFMAGAVKGGGEGEKERREEIELLGSFLVIIQLSLSRDP